ncbi:MAG: DUF3800 domain-containing protein [Janthinobacterium lividum]
MVLQAFFDDSGSEPSSKYFVIAGYAATSENWAEFSTEWKKLLDQYPPLDYFKMSEAWNMRGQFSRPGWTTEIRDRRVSALVNLIPKYTQLRAGAYVKYQDWIELAKPLVAVERTLGTDTPYSYLAWTVVSIITLMAKHDKLQPGCQFIFDQQGCFNDDLLMQWSNIRESSEIQETAAWMPQYPMFHDEVTYLPLQAADAYAWLVRRCSMPIQPLDSRIVRWLETSESVTGGKFNVSRAHLRSLLRGHRTVTEQFRLQNPDVLLHSPDPKARKASRKARKSATASLREKAEGD